MKNKKFLSLLLVAPIFLASCVHNNGMCECVKKVDENDDGLCDVCGKQIEGKCVHKDENGDHICDICGIELPHELVAKSLGKVTTPELIMVGETLKTDQVKVVVVYDDGSNVEKNPSSVTLDTSVAGDIEGSLECEGLSTKFVMKVVALDPSTVIDKLGAVTSPASINKDAKLDVSSVSVVVYYKDGNSDSVIPDSIELDTSTIGTKTGKVNFQGFSANFTIEVKEASEIKTLVSLGKVTAPAEVLLGSTLQVNQVSVLAQYDDGSSEEVTPDTVELDTSVVGDITGKVTYQGKEATFTSRVSSAEGKNLVNLGEVSVPKEIRQNGELSPSEVTVIAYFDDGSSMSVNPDTVVLNTSVSGNATGVVVYKNLLASFTITVLSAVKEVTVIESPKTILLNQKLDPSQVKLLISYTDGKEETVQADRIVLDTSSVGAQPGYAYYKDVSAVFAISVELGGDPSTVITKIDNASGLKEVAKNYKLTVDDVTVYAFFADGTSKSVKPDSVSADTSVAGPATVTVSYAGFTTTYQITVKDTKEVTTYLVLSSVGLYEGKAGASFPDLFLENAIAFTATPGQPLPGKDKVTHLYGSCDFAGWIAYEGTGAPTTYTTVPFEENKILYASFVDNGQTPTPPTPPDPPVPPVPVETETFYLITKFTDGSDDWDRYAEQTIWAYVWKGEDNNAFELHWHENRTWKVDIPVSRYDWVIFCRLKPEATMFDWSLVYNQTIDMQLSSDKHTAQIDNWNGGAHWVS